MCNLAILFVHFMATLARLLGPGGIRSVVAESVLVKQQLLILNRSRQRSPNLFTSERVPGELLIYVEIAGNFSLFLSMNFSLQVLISLLGTFHVRGMIITVRKAGSGCVRGDSP